MSKAPRTWGDLYATLPGRIGPEDPRYEDYLAEMRNIRQAFAEGRYIDADASGGEAYRQRMRDKHPNYYTPQF